MQEQDLPSFIYLIKTAWSKDHKLVIQRIIHRGHFYYLSVVKKKVLLFWAKNWKGWCCHSCDLSFV